MLKVSRLLIAHPSQWDSPAFKAWFGQSKVVDKEGRPQVCYHGTSARFDEFKGKRGSHLGFHFGTAEAANERLEDTQKSDSARHGEPLVRLYTDEEKALRLEEHRILEKALSRESEELHKKALERVTYDNRGDILAALQADDDAALEQALAKGRPQFTTEEKLRVDQIQAERKKLGEKEHILMQSIKPGANVIPVYLRIEKPLSMKDAGNWGSPLKIWEVNPFNFLQDKTTLSSIREAIQAKGYDGIVYSNIVESPGSLAYIIFDSTQAKSAVGNNGTFNPDIKKIIK